MDNIIETGLVHFQTRADSLKFERAVARGLAEDARSRKIVLAMKLAEVAASFEALLESGVVTSAIAEALAILMDAVSDADHACNRDIDAAGWHFDSLDLSKARAMLDGLRP